MHSFLSAQTLQHALKQLSASDVDIHVLTIPTNSFSCSLLIVLCIFVYCKTNTLIPVILIERQQLLLLHVTLPVISKHNLLSGH